MITDTERETLRKQLRTQAPGRDAKIRLTANVPVGLYQRCELLSQVMDTDMAFVVAEALRVFFEGEKAFADFVRQHPEKLPLVANGKRGKRATAKVNKTGSKKDDGTLVAA